MEPSDPEGPLTEVRRETPEELLERAVGSAERADDALLITEAAGGDVDAVCNDLREGGAVEVAMY